MVRAGKHQVFSILLWLEIFVSQIICLLAILVLGDIKLNCFLILLIILLLGDNSEFHHPEYLKDVNERLLVNLLMQNTLLLVVLPVLVCNDIMHSILDFEVRKWCILSHKDFFYLMCTLALYFFFVRCICLSRNARVCLCSSFFIFRVGKSRKAKCLHFDTRPTLEHFLAVLVRWVLNYPPEDSWSVFGAWVQERNWKK